MKKLIFVSILLVMCTAHIQSQVFTRHLSSDQSLDEFIYFPIEQDITFYQQPDIDFDQILAEDSQKDNPLYRIAVKVDQHYTVSDGMWFSYGNSMIWQIGFSAPNASSLNFLISDLSIPIGA